CFCFPCAPESPWQGASRLGAHLLGCAISAEGLGALLSPLAREMPPVVPSDSHLDLEGSPRGWLPLGLKQKGRDAFRKGHCGLRALVPGCQQWDSPAGCQELSEGRLLQGSMDYSQFLPGENRKMGPHKSLSGKLHKQTRTHCASPREGKDPVPEQVMVRVPQGCREASFWSSNASLSSFLEKGAFASCFLSFPGWLLWWGLEGCLPACL
uniref:Uncharacterized protein n=1 Tax=Laticauda laticaudata TaxID=8630 RepID=A0A8C5RL69_LATLA